VGSNPTATATRSAWSRASAHAEARPLAGDRSRLHRHEEGNPQRPEDRERTPRPDRRPGESRTPRPGLSDLFARTSADRDGRDPDDRRQHRSHQGQPQRPRRRWVRRGGGRPDRLGERPEGRGGRTRRRLGNAGSRGSGRASCRNRLLGIREGKGLTRWGRIRGRRVRVVVGSRHGAPNLPLARRRRKGSSSPRHPGRPRGRGISRARGWD
jgi:hypothetical protein